MYLPEGHPKSIIDPDGAARVGVIVVVLVVVTAGNGVVWIRGGADVVVVVLVVPAVVATVTVIVAAVVDVRIVGRPVVGRGRLVGRRVGRLIGKCWWGVTAGSIVGKVGTRVVEDGWIVVRDVVNGVGAAVDMVERAGPAVVVVVDVILIGKSIFQSCN